MPSYISHIHPHSVMFHHFHGGIHPESQGSISGEDFSRLLDWLDDNFLLIGAREFEKKILADSLSDKEVCISFDDALLCQFDIACPILKQRNLDAYFFIYSSPLLGKLDELEIFRDFRATKFADIEDFYDGFFGLAEGVVGDRYSDEKRKFDALSYLKDFPFYTDSDRWFRYLRDQVLRASQYSDLMWQFISDRAYNPDAEASRLWMNEGHVQKLVEDGHVVGLHSFDHPTVMSHQSSEVQEEQYRKNKKHLEKIVGRQITSMSHPCGNYSDTTLNILTKMGVRVGFRSSLSIPTIQSNLEIPRQDHILAFREMNQ